MIKILFVCRRNLTRSIVAEYLLNDYVKKNYINGIIADSAGIEVKKYPNLITTHLTELKKQGINVPLPNCKELTKKLVDENDLIIAMEEGVSKILKRNLELKQCYLMSLFME